MWTGANGEGGTNGFAEAAGAIAQQHRYVVGEYVCGREVLVAVAVEVTYGNRIRVSINRDRRAAGRAEAAGAIPQQHHHIVGGRVRYREVLFAVAIEIAHRNRFRSRARRRG